MARYINDIESYPNFFCSSYLNLDTEVLFIFEISSRKNQLQEFVDFCSKIKRIDSVVGFNSAHYDSVVINYILDNAGEFSFMTGEEIAFRVKDVSDAIINSNDGYFPSWLYPQKYHKKWIDCDLYLLLWSREIRISKAVSLKKIGIQLGYPVTMELPYPHYENLNESQMDKVIEYNSIHDIGITRMLTEKTIYFQGKKTTVGEQVKMRFDAQKKYGFPLYSTSWDGVKLGVQILLKTYSIQNNLDYYALTKIKGETPDFITLSEIVSPLVNFKEGSKSFILVADKDKKGRGKKGRKAFQFDTFYGLYQYILTKKVKDTKELSCKVFLGGLRYDIKSGGLHTAHSAEIVRPEKGMIYEDWDVSGYYPNLGVALKVQPVKFPRLYEVLIVLTEMKRRAKAEGRLGEERLAKISSNGGFYGSLNSPTNAMYSPKDLLRITINGQLFLLMLIERLFDIGVRIDSANTDGISIIYEESRKEEIREVIANWENETGMKMEVDVFSFVARRDVNNYIAVRPDGSTKKKGIFVTTPDIGNGCDNLIIAYALEAYYATNTPPEVFIPKYLEDNPNDGIYAFCSSQKVAKSYIVVWGGEQQQQINRYYVCRDGKYLYKQRNGGSNAIMKGIPIKIYNNHNGTNPKDIDVQWYINECRKVIEEISPTVKTTLF